MEPQLSQCALEIKENSIDLEAHEMGENMRDMHNRFGLAVAEFPSSDAPVGSDEIVIVHIQPVSRDEPLVQEKKNHRDKTPQREFFSVVSCLCGEFFSL